MLHDLELRFFKDDQICTSIFHSKKITWSPSKSMKISGLTLNRFMVIS